MKEFAKKNIKYVLLIVLAFFAIIFAKNSSLDENSTMVKKNVQKTSSSFVTNTQEEGNFIVKSVIEQDDTLETIPSAMFELNGVSNDITLSDEWEYEAGIISKEKFPTYEGYRYVNVTVDGVAVKNIGITKIPDGTIRYYYLTTNDFEDDLSITILPDDMKFVINYSINEFNIDYDIVMKDESEVPSNITVESVFGAERPTETVNHKYSFDVRVPNGYTAKVYRYLGNNDLNPEELTKDREYPLGTSLVYSKVGNNLAIDTTKGPSEFVTSATFYNNAVTENRRIVVELTKKETPKFDAHVWLQTAYAKGRGTTAQSTTHQEPGNGNLIPKYGTWDWGDLAKDNGQENLTQEDDGSYSYTWYFQTNGGGGTGGYILNALSINGVSVTIPFSPGELGYNNGIRSDIPMEETPNKEESVKVTTLPDGTIVTITYVRAFYGGNNNNQRVYEIKITNAYSNIYVTGGNFHDYSGAEEVIAYSLIGVNADEESDATKTLSVQYYGINNKNWNNMALSAVEVASFLKNGTLNSGDSNHGGATVRFKLVNGYKNPTYSLKKMSGEVIDNQEAYDVIKKIPATLESNHIYGPDDDGWYYIKVTNQGSEKIALLTVEATKMQYVVQYTSDDSVKTPQNMPNYNDLIYDNNGGNYYDIVINNLITINSNIPKDPTENMIFNHWSVVDNNGEVIDDIVINPGQALALEDVYEYAIYDESINGGTNIIRLEASWEKAAEPFEYNVSMIYVDKNNEEHQLDEILSHIITKNIYDTGNTLTISLNKESEKIREWLSNHPTYSLDDNKNGNYIYEIENDATIYVYLQEANGGLFFSKKVIDDKNDNNTFDFEIYNDYIPDGIYKAFEKGLESDNISADEYIDVPFSDGKATISLKNEEGITIYVPSGTYNITEKGNKNNDDYDVLINNEVSNSAAIEVNPGEITDEVIVINTLKATTVSIVKGQEPTSYESIKVGDKITYTITVTNEGEVKAHDVVVTDVIPEGLINVEIDSFSNGDVNIDDGTIIWNIEDMEKDATEKLVITAEIPKVTETTMWTNIAEVNYTNMPKDYDGKSNSVVAKTVFGNLTVTNKVTGNSSDAEKEFTFIVTLDDETINGTYGDMTFENGKAEFTLKHGEQKVAENLPSYIKYEVIEVEANEDGYTTTSTGGQGTIEEGAIVEFINDKEIKKVEKPVEDVPKTLDNIVMWITIMILSLISIIVVVFYLRKRKKIK